MPKFKNNSKSRIDLIYNGRKIMIPVGGIIEGPPHLKLYKGLELYNEGFVVQPNRSPIIEFIQSVISSILFLVNIQIEIEGKEQYSLI